MEKLPKYLPNIEKADVPEPEKFEEAKVEARKEKSRTIWIIVLAFALVASLGVIGWFLFSGRADQRVHGENLDAFLDKPTETPETSTKLGDIDPGVVVNDAEINLTDYDSNITITASGTHTLSGISNYSVLVNADGVVTLRLNGVTISSVETAAIANQSTNPLTVELLEGTTNALTDGGSSVYDGALFSNGALTVKGGGYGDSLGKLVVSGRQTDGEGIATANAPLTIESGKIMVTASDDGLNAGGDQAGVLTIDGGILWIKASGDGVDSNDKIVINGGNLLVIGSAAGGNGALDSDNGIFLNGGNIVALGSDMLEKPSSESAQKFLSAELTETVSTGSTVYIKNIDTNVIFNFKTEGDFKNLLFSSASLTAGNYEISLDGRLVGTGVVE